MNWQQDFDTVGLYSSAMSWQQDFDAVNLYLSAMRQLKVLTDAKHKINEEIHQLKKLKDAKKDVLEELKYHPTFLSRLIEEKGDEQAFEILGY